MVTETGTQARRRVHATKKYVCCCQICARTRANGALNDLYFASRAEVCVCRRFVGDEERGGGVGKMC